MSSDANVQGDEMASLSSHTHTTPEDRKLAATIELRQRIRNLREQVDIMENELAEITGECEGHADILDDDDLVSIAATRNQIGTDEPSGGLVETSPDEKDEVISVHSANHDSLPSTSSGASQKNSDSKADASKPSPGGAASPKRALKFTKFGKRIIPSPGSQARDHLANIRTYLAWVRTALSAVGFGFTVYALGLEPIGFVFVIVGLMTLVYGFALYFLTQKAIIVGEMRIPHRGILIGTAILIALIFAGLVIAAVDIATPGSIISGR